MSEPTTEAEALDQNLALMLQQMQENSREIMRLIEELESMETETKELDSTSELGNVPFE